nr:RNA-directed DNA polymerase, eukaryota, reverse transcriptase zinc-binding domain protein [Tanacetum cinerariifolium]
MVLLRVFIQDHIGRVILFGDLNEVRSESERFGSTFSRGDATIFNSFIHDTGLIDHPMGGRHFTWVNEVGSKMSKLDRFLISDDVIHSNTDLKVVALDRLWSDHNPNLLHCKKNDFGIMLDGVWNSEPKDIKSAFLDFYKDKFSCHDSPISFPLMLSAHRLSIAYRDFLETMVSMDEIKAVDLLKPDIQSFFVRFFFVGTFPKGSNSAFITLIPNVSNPLFIKDYRPISLIGIHYKIVAKILANRLSKVIDSIISPEQSAFITGRQILDGPFILSETIDWYKKRKKKMMLFKVNFEKAFDYVSRRVFFKKRFEAKGSSLTFLFIILMEGLHMALNDGLAANMFYGVKILNIFYIASGLKINIHKSNVYEVGVRLMSLSFTILRLDYRVGRPNFSPFVVTLLSSNMCSVALAIHGYEAGIDIRGCHTNGVWASIVGSIFHLHSSGIVPLSSIRFKVGDGTSILFWKDIWLGNDPLYIRYNRLYHLEKNKDCFIQQRIANDSWFWDWSRPVNVGRTKTEFDAFISGIASLEPEELVYSDTCI